MFTFFTIPKGFSGEFSLIQENAILSWKSIPDSQVILFGNEVGVKEFAKLNNIDHFDNIQTNINSTPLLSEVFQLAKKNAKNEILIYVNCDIIFTSSIISTINLVKEYFKNYVIVGRRSDAFINENIVFNNNWEYILNSKLTNNVKLHSKSGIDYFIFPKSLVIDMPNFAVGRPSWDNWMIYYFLKRSIPLIDSTKMNTVIHQNHQRGYAIYGQESKINFNLAGGTINLCDISHSNYHIINYGEENVIAKNYYGIFKFFYPIRFLFSLRLDLINFYLEKIKNIK